MFTVAETPLFTRQIAKLFSEDERAELIDYLAENPFEGDEIPGTGVFESCVMPLPDVEREAERVSFIMF